MKFKRLIPLCCVLFALLFSLTASATQQLTLTQHQMDLFLPDDFTVITRENVAQHGELLKEYDTTVTQTQIKLEQENYLVLAISKTMNCTLYLSCVENSVSATIGDLITYENSDTAKQLLLGKNPPETAQIKELGQRGALFYRVDFGVQEKIGRIAYITVLNGKCYTLGLVDNNGTLNSNMNALIDRVFETWEYTVQAEAQKIQAFRDKVTTVFYWIALPVALIVGGILVRLLLKDLQNKEQLRKRKENIPKRPRR